MERSLPFAVLLCLAQMVPMTRSQGKTISDVSRITGKQAIVQRAEPTQESVPNENVVIRVLSDGNGEHNDNSLSCYACDYENDGRWCKDVANRSLFSMTRCPNKEHVCQVWHFYSTNTDENYGRATYYFKRGCAETCQPGCTSLDDMEHRFVSCFSCCTETLCNTDNKASSTSFLGLSVLVLWICAIM